jgi:hypothetical protein
MKRLWDRFWDGLWKVTPYVWSVLLVVGITCLAALLVSVLIWCIVDIWRVIV